MEKMYSDDLFLILLLLSLLVSFCFYFSFILLYFFSFILFSLFQFHFLLSLCFILLYFLVSYSFLVFVSFSFLRFILLFQFHFAFSFSFSFLSFFSSTLLSFLVYFSFYFQFHFPSIFSCILLTSSVSICFLSFLFGCLILLSFSVSKNVVTKERFTRVPSYVNSLQPSQRKRKNILPWRKCIMCPEREESILTPTRLPPSLLLTIHKLKFPETAKRRKMGGKAEEEADEKKCNLVV